MSQFIARPLNGELYLVWNHTVRHAHVGGRMLNPATFTATRMTPTALEKQSFLMTSFDSKAAEVFESASRGLVMIARLLTEDVLSIPFDARRYATQVLSVDTCASLARGVPMTGTPAPLQTLPTPAPAPPFVAPAPPPVENPNITEAIEAPAPPVPPADVQDTLPSPLEPPEETVSVPAGDLSVETSEGPANSAAEEAAVVVDEDLREGEKSEAPLPEVEAGDVDLADAGIRVLDQAAFDAIPWDELNPLKDTHRRDQLREWGKLLEPPITGNSRELLAAELLAAHAALQSK